MYFVLKNDDVKKRAMNYIGSLGTHKPQLVEVKEYKSNRSTAQNRLYWSWVKVFSDYMGEDKDDLHEKFKASFLGVKEVTDFNGNTYVVPKSTANLGVRKFAEYLNKIELTAAKLELVLPIPEDYRFAMTGDRDA